MSTQSISSAQAAIRPPHDYLRIYLTDHHAGARMVIDLVRRMLSNNEGTPLGSYLREGLLPETESDLGVLEDVMARLGVTPQWWKDTAARVAERAGRLKLNGQMRGYSPLSRVLELEALVVALTAKRLLWESLRDLAPSEPRLSTVDFEALIRRADEQCAQVTKHHGAATAAAFRHAM